jgi:hypothetical protein
MQVSMGILLAGATPHNMASSKQPYGFRVRKGLCDHSNARSLRYRILTLSKRCTASPRDLQLRKRP